MEKGTDTFHRKKSHLTNDSFCIFSPLNPTAKEKKKSGIEWLQLKTGCSSPEMFLFLKKQSNVLNKFNLGNWKIIPSSNRKINQRSGFGKNAGNLFLFPCIT